MRNSRKERKKMQAQTDNVFSKWARKSELEQQILSGMTPEHRWKVRPTMLTGLIYPLQIYHALRVTLRDRSPQTWKMFWDRVREICGREEK
jgi:hypothetical protein